MTEDKVGHLPAIAEDLDAAESLLLEKLAAKEKEQNCLSIIARVEGGEDVDRQQIDEAYEFIARFLLDWLAVNGLTFNQFMIEQREKVWIFLEERKPTAKSWSQAYADAEKGVAKRERMSFRAQLGEEAAALGYIKQQQRANEGAARAREKRAENRRDRQRKDLWLPLAQMYWLKDRNRERPLTDAARFVIKKLVERGFVDEGDEPGESTVWKHLKPNRPSYRPRSKNLRR